LWLQKQNPDTVDAIACFKNLDPMIYYWETKSRKGVSAGPA